MYEIRMEISPVRVYSKYIVNIMELILSAIISYKIIPNILCVFGIYCFMFLSKKIKQRFSLDVKIKRKNVYKKYKINLILFFFFYTISLWLISNNILGGIFLYGFFIFYDLKYNYGLIMKGNIIKTWFVGDEIKYKGKIYTLIQKMRIKNTFCYKVVVDNKSFIWKEDRVIFMEGELAKSLAQEILRYMK